MPPPTNNQAATTDYGTAYAEFGNVYDPQVQQVQAQEAQLGQAKDTTLAQLKQDNTTKLSQLDQAKSNAFSNNALTANARGINFSGYTPFTNNAYTVNTYNPNVQATNTDYQRGVDKTNTDYTNNYQTLQQKITDINQQRANDANSLVQNTRQAQQQAALSAYKSGLPSSSQNQQAFSNASLANLEKQIGSDGHISPETYAQEAIKWLNAGYSVANLNSLLSSTKLLNPKNGYYQYALNEALKRAK